MSSKTTLIISLLTILGVILGGVAGMHAPQLMLSIGFIGQLFVNGLKIIVLPLIIVTVIIGLNGMGSNSKISRSLGKTAAYFGLTSLASVLIGMAVSLIIQPGLITSKAGASIPESITQINNLDFSSILGRIFPDNFFMATTEGQLIGLIIFSILVAYTLTNMSKQSKIILDFCEAINEILTKILYLFLYLAPLGIFSLIGKSFAESYHFNGIFTSLASFSATVGLGFVLLFIFIFPLVLRLFGKQDIIDYYGNLIPAFTTALGTGSSAATLPITRDCVVNMNKIDSRAGAFVLPLGTAVNLNGTALYLSVSAIFIAQLYGVDLTMMQLIIIGFLSLLLSFGGTLVPQGTIISLAIIISAAGLPAQAYAGIGLIALIDWLFGRIRALVDVTGDAVGAAVIGETFDFKTARKTRLTSARTTDKPYRSGKSDYKTRESKSSKPRGKSESRSKSRTKTEPVKKTRAKTAVKKTAAAKPKTARKTTKPPVKEKAPAAAPKKAAAKKTEAVESKSEKKNIFVLPPVPQIPGHSAKTAEPLTPPATDVIKTVDTETKPDVISLSNETVERERAKISAQLDEMRKKEEVKVEDNIEIKPVVEESPVVEETTPVIDDVVEDQVVESKPIEEKVEKTDEPVAVIEEDLVEAKDEAKVEAKPEIEEKPEKTETPADESKDETEEEKPAVKYGRSKPRKSVAKPKPDVEKTEDDDSAPKPVESGFSSENISYGRGRKKK